ncbi:hypothetical protein [Nocardia sp. NPDC019395]|uniref:hypothetical protein n=1 Tax=Nocardia sp. NPDC019395 TaxID=3154686 RepID=UPI0033D3330F
MTPWLRISVNNNADYNFIMYARAKRCDSAGNNCEVVKQQEVIAATSGNTVASYYPGAMPAGNPIGLLTVYCNYNDPSKLRCEDWVNKPSKPARSKICHRPSHDSVTAGDRAGHRQRGRLLR